MKLDKAPTSASKIRTKALKHTVWIAFSSDDTPPDLFLTSLAGDDRSERQVTISPLPEFSRYSWVTPRYVTFPSHVDGSTLHGRLTLPPNFDPESSYPAGSDEDAIMEAAIEAGAEDVIVDESQHIEVLTDPVEYESVRDAMRAAGLEPENAGLTMRATTVAELDLQPATSMIKMLEMLEDLDDVQQVYSNAGISDEILAQI